MGVRLKGTVCMGEKTDSHSGGNTGSEGECVEDRPFQLQRYGFPTLQDNPEFWKMMFAACPPRLLLSSGEPIATSPGETPGDF